ncbi:MAG: hypothetical protein AB7L71_02430 [Vicinamibacterales bacterium]
MAGRRPEGDRPAQLLAAACQLAESTPQFQAVLGAGAGDHATARFLRELRRRAEAFGAKDCHERKLCGASGFAVDFYFEAERTIVEVALGLPNSQSEFEKDVFKAMLARHHGHGVDRLLFITRAGGRKKCAQPGRAAVIAWVRDHHDLVVEVHDLPGEPRRRVRMRPASITRTTPQQVQPRPSRSLG